MKVKKKNINKPTLKELCLILKMLNGESVPFSVIKRKDGLSPCIQMMVDEKLIEPTYHGTKTVYNIPVHLKTDCDEWISRRWNIQNVAEAISVLKNGNATRIEIQKALGNSKYKKTDVYKGFLCKTSYPVILPVHKDFSIAYHDQKDIPLTNDVIIVYFENFTNYRQAERYNHLFPAAQLLYVTKYPNEKIVLSWLKNISNQVLYFGDFDPDGIRGYNSFYKALGERVSLVIPEDYDERIRVRGDPDLFKDQGGYSKRLTFDDPRIEGVVRAMYKYGKGYEQEAFAK